MNTTPTDALSLDPARTIAPKRRPERHFYAGGHFFDCGVLAEDFDPATLFRRNDHYVLPVEIDDPDPSSQGAETWQLVIPATVLTSPRIARLVPSAEVLFVAHLYGLGYDPLYEDLDEFPVARSWNGPCRADVVRFAVVNARRRAWTRYARP